MHPRKRLHPGKPRIFETPVDVGTKIRENSAEPQTRAAKSTWRFGGVKGGFGTRSGERRRGKGGMEAAILNTPSRLGSPASEPERAMIDAASPGMGLRIGRTGLGKFN